MFTRSLRGNAVDGSLSVWFRFTGSITCTVAPFLPPAAAWPWRGFICLPCYPLPGDRVALAPAAARAANHAHRCGRDLLAGPPGIRALHSRLVERNPRN